MYPVMSSLCLLQVRYTQLVRQKRRKPVVCGAGGPWRSVSSVSEGRLGARGGSRRSGYAFAHQEGFGELITSGKNMRLSSLALATFASRHSSSWIDTLRRRKQAPAQTSQNASGECSPAPSCVSGSVPPLSNSSSVLGSSQDTPIEEEVVTESVQSLHTNQSECFRKHLPSGTNRGTSPTAVKSLGGESSGEQALTLGPVQVGRR